MDTNIVAREYDKRVSEHNTPDPFGDNTSEDSLQSIFSRRSTGSKSSKTSQDTDDTDDENRFVSFYEGLGWKQIVFLQHNSFWQDCLVTTILLHFFILVYSYHFINDADKIIFYTDKGKLLLIVFEVMYAIDTVLSIIYVHWKSIHSVNVNPPRPIVQLCCDVLALIPVEYIYWQVSVDIPTKQRVNIYYCLTSHSLIRTYRVFTYFHNIRKTLNYEKILMVLLETVTYLTMLTHASSAILFILYCRRKDETCYFEEDDFSKRFAHAQIDNDFDWYVSSFYIMTGKWTFKGVPIFSRSIASQMLFASVNVISFLVIYGYMMGQIVSAMVQNMQPMFSFSHRLMVIKRQLLTLKITKKVSEDIITYYKILWENWSGVNESNINYELLPKIIHRDLNLDIYGDVFKRSHLFQNINESFLSFLALKMKTEFYMPGDILYGKDIPKTRMIYLITGIIQILTDEDDDSPIISFSGGTLLGETSLIYQFKSSVVVRCATYCEVQVLDTKSFHLVVNNYPDIHASLKAKVQERVTKSKELQEVGAKGLKETDIVQLEDVNENAVKWIKNFFQSAMAKKKKHASWASSVLEFASMNSDVHRTVTYLNLYVFTEQLELNKDDVCLRTTCPWILKPKSVVLKTWNYIIVCLTIFVAIYLPYCAFYRYNQPDSFRAIMYGVEIMYVMDLLVQTSTAIKRKQELIAEWKHIFYLRLSEFGFIADILAVLPLEFMEYTIKTWQQGKRNMTGLLMLNKLIKLWRVEKYFQGKEKITNLNVTYAIRDTKYLFYLIYCIYIFGGLFYMESCLTPKCERLGWYNYFYDKIQPNAKKDSYGNFTTATLFSTVVVLGNSYFSVMPSSARDLAFTLFAMLLSFILVLYIYSATVSMEMLITKDWSLFQDTYKAIKSHMKDHKMDDGLQSRVVDYLDFCWANDNAFYLIHGKSPFYDLIPYLSERMYGPPLAPHLTKMVLFKDSDPQFITQLARRCKIRVLQPNEVVFYSGEPATSLYVITQGYCQSVSNFSKTDSVETLGPNAVMNAVEVVLQLTNINTVRTVTCCELIQMELESLLFVLKKFPRAQALYRNLKDSCREWKDIPELQAVNESSNIFAAMKTKDLKNSWYKFPYHPLESGGSRDENYEIPFRNLGYFYYIMFFFLRRTIAPDGCFMMCWEIFRAIFAILTSIIVPAAGALEVYTFPSLIYIRYALDVTAIADLYVRLHVAFYDDRGIVVSHPLETAKHYLTHAFLLDVIAVFPFEIFGIGREDLSLYYYLLFIRVLQFHRVVQLLRYLEFNVQVFRQFPSIINATKLLLIGLVLCNVFGGLLVLVRCEYSNANTMPDRFEKGIYCNNWYYVEGADNIKNYKEPFSPSRVYLYNVYFATSILTRCGLGSAMTLNRDHALVVIGMAILGFWLLMYMHAKIIATSCSAYVKPTKHQEKMNSLLKFIKTKKISKELREEVIHYFELLWKRKKAAEANTSFSSFHLTLREDIFLRIYGKNLLKCAVFASANRSFLCKLITACRVELFMKGSTILRPYEITSRIYFINKGKVDIYVTGNVKVCSSLTVGCMFGNLANVQNYSHNYTVMARGHVDVLAIPSNIFHDQLTLHQKIQKAYNTSLVNSPSDFYMADVLSEDNKYDSVKDDFEDGMLEFMYSSIKIDQSSGHNKYESKCFHTFLPRSTFVKVISAILLVTSYVTFFTCTYAFAWGIRTTYFYVFLIATDLLFCFRIYMKFQLAYYDDGYLITDPKTIALRYMNIRKQPIGFYYDIVAIFPFDVFCLLAPVGERLFYSGILRINRVLTAIYVINWLWKQNNKLNINIILTRFAFIAAWMTMMLHTLTFFLNIFKCIEEANCYMVTRTTSPSDFFHDYCHELHVVVLIFTGSTIAREDLMPNSIPLILYCIFTMAIARLLAAIFIGEACAIIESTNRTLANYTDMVQRIWAFFTIQELSPPLRQSLWSYVSLLWRINRGEQVPQLLRSAPYYLREAIKTSLYGGYVQPNPVFSECHEDFLRQLITCLKQYIFFPGNYVTFAGDMDDNMYFVYSGEVEFFLPVERFEDEDVKGILFEGDAFGMMQGVYPKKEHAYNYRARTVAILLILNRADWENMLNSFPAVKREIYNKASGWHYHI